jgi:uncharacterized protein (TIGR02265 family)
VTLAVDLERARADLNLDQRLAQVPLTARSRGVFFNMLGDELRKRGFGDVTELQRLVDTRKSYGLYPTRDLVHAYGIAGALIDPDPLRGIRTLFTSTPRYLSGTWYGKAFARYLRPDPAAALHYIERSREFVANYGRWRLETRGPQHMVLHMFDEYFWIEAAQLGGCEGMLIACGVEGEVTAELEDPFTGRLHIRWRRR